LYPKVRFAMCRWMEEMEQPDDPSVLIRADRLASLGRLVAEVAHEVNNPISYVIGNLAELERLAGAMREALGAYRGLVERMDGGADLVRSLESKLDEAGGLSGLDEILTDAIEGASRIRDLIQDLLALSRESGRSREPLDVHEVLESTLRLVGPRLDPVARLSRDYLASSRIPGDRTRLGQVLLNLLTNAIDACDSPDRSRHQISIRTEDVAGGVAIEVEDSGGGIAPERQPLVFTPFFTTKDAGEGTGLGLYISRRIVEAHGGTLDFSSEEAGGATFRVFLPGRPQGDARGTDG
jgi:signal transduction histidine kinase